MRGLLNLRFALILAAAAFVAHHANAGQVVSSARNVKAVMQARGFYLAPVQNAPVSYTWTGADLAPVQSFEIIRPRGERVTIGRLYTSCTCVQLEAPKRTFERGEPAILNLHNVMATPPGGQNYAVYVQITSPIRTTLRIDTYVQSDQFTVQPVVSSIEPMTENDLLAQDVETAEAQDVVDETETALTETPDTAVGGAGEAAAADEPAEKEKADAAEAAEAVEAADEDAAATEAGKE